nr:hypothetical protein GCM10020093_000720 [Planobispora longispora]
MPRVPRPEVGALPRLPDGIVMGAEGCGNGADPGADGTEPYGGGAEP